MLISLLLATGLAHAEPGDIIKLNESATLNFKQKMDECATLYGWTRCYDVYSQRFGTTGMERVTDWLRGVEVTLVAQGREVIIHEERIGEDTYMIEVGPSMRAYAIHDIDDDGLDDLMLQDTTGVWWIVPNETAHPTGRI